MSVSGFSVWCLSASTMMLTYSCGLTLPVFLSSLEVVLVFLAALSLYINFRIILSMVLKHALL